jgi:hypothetical protein
LRRSVKRPKLTTADRFLWARLSRYWTGWRSALLIVKPETVIHWHRKGFRLLWTWKVRRGQPGRPSVCQETWKLIRQMSRDNPLWGAPRIHGELLKLGIDIASPVLANIWREAASHRRRVENPPAALTLRQLDTTRGAPVVTDPNQGSK